MEALKMPVIPNDFLMLAQNFTSSCDEIQLRNSVSRAYYAGYLHVVSRIKSAGINLVTTQTGFHDKLIHTLNSNGCSKLNGGMTPKEQYELAGVLSLSKQLRTKADYYLDETITQYDKDSVITNTYEIYRLVP
ncbi:hypothetical protein [Pantoea ananatis]|uniref:hypothetical protein n=1 Tax=Pantoea ananas TaxID=553 RepID=UPI0023B056AD|nr:hypothetical protein [Pantoea ananatis]